MTSTVEKPLEMDFASIRSTLMRIITLCLDYDLALIPFAASPTDEQRSEDSDSQPDDFRFWSEKQAARIALCIKYAFDVEYAPEVVVADAMVSRELLAETH